MIINSILSLAFLWSWKKCKAQLTELRLLRRKITTAAIDSVSDAIKNMEKVPQGKKIFMIVKGLINFKIKLRGQKSIYSLFQLSEIKQGKLAQHYMKKIWEQLSTKAYWKQPYNTANLKFNLQDMVDQKMKVGVKGCQEEILSGALNEIYKDRNIKSKPNNILLRLVIKIYNFFVSRLPLSYLFGTTNIGEELTLYGILDGQYSLIIGQFERIDNEIVCKFPNYVTKQRCYVQSKLLKKQKKLLLMTFLLASLLIITGIKFVRRFYQYIKKWQMKRNVDDKKQEDRSQNEGENCNCIVCFQNIRNIVFKPCRHYAICKTCFKLLPKSICPYCKEVIQDIIEIIKKK